MVGKPRDITVRLRGIPHGPITRLISPDGVGEQLKPFIFLDFFNGDISPGFGFPMHPHSGIATLTWQPTTDVRYRDTTGKYGLLEAGGLEWMNAGGGAWHEGTLMGSGLAIGFQLWVALPPGVEDGASFGQYIPPEDVPFVDIEGGQVEVLLGALGDPASHTFATSPIDSNQDINYFVVSLQLGASWRFQPPEHHDVAWVFPFEGTCTIQGSASSRELCILSGNGTIELSAEDGPCQVLVGTARSHPHPLILGRSSVHTNIRSLEESEARIRSLADSLARS